MEVKVSKDRIKITDEIIHKGEYKINDLNFSFTNEYLGLNKMAVFSKNGVSYSISIVNDKCYIPAEVLTEDCTITFGVYAYVLENNEVVQRYSPAPIQLVINKGSYEENTITPIDEVEPSAFEEFTQEVINSINELNTNKQDKLTAGANITIDENNVISASGGGGGTSNYNDLTNKPSINGVTLSGNKTLVNLGIQGTLTAGTNISISSNTISTTGVETTSNKVTSISSSSTNNQYPTAKLLYDKLLLKQNQFITELTANLYLVNGTTPTLTEGYYYTNSYRVYVNGTVDNKFDNSIFYYKPNGVSGVPTLSVVANTVPYQIAHYVYHDNNTTWDTINTVQSDFIRQSSITSSITSSSTNEQVAGAKAVYDNSLEIYSTTEQRVGTWIDGKPLYRKTCVETMTSGTSMSVPLSLNIDTFVKLVTTIKKVATGNEDYENSFYSSTDDWGRAFFRNNTSTGMSLELRRGNNYSSRTFVYYIDLYYTKTTASTNSLNTAKLMNTGSLVGMGDRAEITIQDDKGSGDEM